MVFSIYRITNMITGLVYIGYTNNPARRWRQHISDASRESTSSLHRAMRRDGVDSFEMMIIYQSRDREHTLRVMEPHFIREYDSIEHGYNMTCGGDGWVDQVSMRGKYGVDSFAKTGYWREQVRQQFSGTKWIWNSDTNLFKRCRGPIPEGWQVKAPPRPKIEKTWRVTTPAGVEMNVSNLNEFCKENGLSQGNMVMVADGKYKQHKGFRCVRTGTK